MNTVSGKASLVIHRKHVTHTRYPQT